MYCVPRAARGDTLVSVPRAARGDTLASAPRAARGIASAAAPTTASGERQESRAAGGTAITRHAAGRNLRPTSALSGVIIARPRQPRGGGS